MFYADRQTDMTKLLLSLLSVANSPKNITHDLGSWGAILWRNLNNGKWASDWELHVGKSGRLILWPDGGILALIYRFLTTL